MTPHCFKIIMLVYKTWFYIIIVNLYWPLLICTHLQHFIIIIIITIIIIIIIIKHMVEICGHMGILKFKAYIL